MKPPDSSASIVRQERSRPSIAWTPELLRVAEAQAARGNLRMAADFCTFLMGDDRIPGLFDTRAEGLFGLTPTFEASSGDGRRRGRAVRAMEAEEDWWTMFPEPVAAEFLLWGLLLGVALGRLEWWERDRKGRRVPRLRKGRLVPLVTWWHPRALRWDGESERWLVRLEGGQERAITPGDGEWLLFTPYGPHEPWMRALWRGLGWLALLKRYSIGDLGRHQEKGSNLFVESPLESTAEQRKEVLVALEGLGSDGIAVLPGGFKADLLEAMSTGELYLRSAEFADKAGAVAILGHANNAEVGDANTGATAGETIRHERREFDARSIEGFAHEQMSRPWAELNFGDPELAPWAVYPTKPKATAKDEGEGLKALGDGIAAIQAVCPRLDGDALLEKHGYPLLTEAQVAERDARKPSPPEPAPEPTPADAPAKKAA